MSVIKNPWSIKQHLDPITGEPTYIYTYKGKSCKRILLDSRLANQLAGWALIEKDLCSVEVWLKEIRNRNTFKPKNINEVFIQGIDRENFNLIKGLFVAALTFYGKCFSRCEGRSAKMERSQLHEKFHKIHDECISYRHNFAAHSGAAKLEKVDIAFVYPAKLHPNSSKQIYYEIFQPDLLWRDGEGAITFEELIMHAKEIVKTKIDFLSLKILTDEIIPKGYEYWKRRE